MFKGRYNFNVDGILEVEGAEGDSVGVRANGGSVEVSGNKFERNSNGIAFGDIDGDRDIDIGVTNLGSNTVSILRNNGDGTFATKVDYEVKG